MSTERFTSRPPGGVRVTLPNGSEGVVLVEALQVSDPQRVRVAWDDGHVTVVRCEQLAEPRDLREELRGLLNGIWADDYGSQQAEAILAAGWRPRA